MRSETDEEIKERLHLENTYGQVWSNAQLKRDFGVYRFEHRTVRVVRKLDGKKGSLLYQDTPRFYFSFLEDKSRDGT